MDRVGAVKGPISAAILTLLRINWDPIEASAWSYASLRDATEEWQFPYSLYIGSSFVYSHAEFLERHPQLGRIDCMEAS
eukprot:6493188-Pyramimonas_sp.AAC.1